MKILFIAGHGDGDSGACGNGYREADLTREVARLLNEKFVGVCEAEVANTNRNWFEYLGSHSYDFSGYDYVLEIHFNAGGGTGTEIYVTTAEVGVGVESAIVRNISAATDLKNRGVKRTNFRVINRIKNQGISAALLECCFIDKKYDVDTYQSKKDAFINAIVTGIAEGFGLKQPAPAHWAQQYYDKLTKLGYITDPAWQDFEGYLPASFALALLDKLLSAEKDNAVWTSEETDASIHWAQPHVISLCGKGVIADKSEWIGLITSEAYLSKTLCLALVDKMTGGMKPAYVGRETDHWGRNHLDSLCDKAIITTPEAWANDFEAPVTYGAYIKLLCGALWI